MSYGKTLLEDDMNCEVCGKPLRKTVEIGQDGTRYVNDFQIIKYCSKACRKLRKK